MRFLLAFATLAALGACGREQAADEGTRTLEILAAHRVSDLDPTGDWRTDGDGYAFQELHIAALSTKGQFSVRIWWCTDAGELEIPGTGSLQDGVLTLVAQDHEFDDRLHLCRFGSRELLIPEEGAWFTRGDDPILLGRFYSRVPAEEEQVHELRDYLPGPDDENRPMRREANESD